MSKTWFITGSANGFGREWAEAALERGDRVAATARDAERLAPLRERFGAANVLPLELDVTDRERVFAAFGEALDAFGGIDVVVNNAGYGHIGMVEELAEQEVRRSLETNLLGALWVTQAALPHFRARAGGHLIQVTSEGGVIAYPSFGAYHAAKWGLEGLTQSLVQEVRGFGIDVTLVEPGPYATGFGDAVSQSAPIAAYDGVRLTGAWERGDPAATRAAILQVVDADAPPLRVFFGRDNLARLEADYAQRLADWRTGQPLAVSAHG